MAVPAAKPAAFVPPKAPDDPQAVAAAWSVVRQRRARQTVTFLSMVAGLVVIGLAAGTNWIGVWRAPGQPAAGAHLVCPTATATAASMSEVSLAVYNGTSRKGLASKVMTELQKRGMTVTEIDNKKVKADKDVAAVVQYTEDKALQAATVQASVEGTVTMQLKESGSDVLNLVLTSGYDALRSKNEVRAIITTQQLDESTCYWEDPTS